MWLDGTFVGHRVCPNPKCRTYVLIVFDGNDVIASFPVQRIDFDTTDVPSDVVSTFEESIECHANGCHVASAIMVRRTLEEICEDKKANGDDLKARIKSLGSQIVIPTELLDGLDELRLLGNDAAHIEAKVFDNIGKPELDVAIKFTKEIIKAVYQFAALLRELQALKSQSQAP